MPGRRRACHAARRRGGLAAGCALLAGLLLGLQFQACSTAPPPVLPELRDLEPREPVVLVPGITGSKLRERETGRVVWGSFRGMFLPHDGGYSVARPLDADSPRRGALEPHEPVYQFRALFGLVDVDIYDSLLRLVEANGYRIGSLDDPRPGDSFFPFAYDWRQGVVPAARLLRERLEALRRSRGDDVLRVHFICQSDAGQVVRYLFKYGGASLEEAEGGVGKAPPHIRLGKLILVGSAAGGALATLEDMNRGRRFVPLVGRRFRPEVIFTFPAVYETLPAYRDDLFFDEEGEPVDADLFDASTWERYGWSVFSPETVRRIERSGRVDLFGDVEERRAFLQRSLDRARRLHRLLQRDVDGFGAAEYYVLGNGYLPTTERALLTRENGRWRTYFADDDRLRSDPYLVTLAAVPGDGHAAWTSQTWMSPQEKAALAHAPVSIPFYHRRIILDRGAHRWILGFLLR